MLHRHEAYESPMPHVSDEDAFNQLFVWPYLHLVGKSVTNEGWKGYFVQGQPFLKSMSDQLRASAVIVDEKSQYKTDRLINLFGMKQLELLYSRPPAASPTRIPQSSTG